MSSGGRHELIDDSSLLALAVARIHRSASVETLAQTFLTLAPALVDADAFGVYLLDNRQSVQALYSRRVERGFLDEYERMRMDDPLFRELLHKPRFLHTRELIDEQEWIKHPLCRLMSRWRLRYSIAAPLIAAGRLAGTINFARCGRGYYDRASLDRARFLCGEVAFAFERVTHLRRLENEAIADHSITCACLPKRTRQVLELAASGAGNRAISQRLYISENTVRDHIKRGYALLSVSNRAQLARRVYGDGSPVSVAGSRQSTATL